MITTTEQQTARHGVWTPWARILCVACDYAALVGSPRAAHYANHLAALAAMDRNAVIPRTDHDALGVCEACEAKCWVRDDVALLQRIGLRADEMEPDGPWSWSMRQTGGMCAALVFTSATHQLVVTAMDEWFTLGLYLLSDEGWEDPISHWESREMYSGGELLSDEPLNQLVSESARRATDLLRSLT